MMGNLKITKLDWDSNYWEISIYNVNKSSEAGNYEYEIKNIYDDRTFLIQALASDDDIEYIKVLEDIGFRFVESKINLIKKIQEKSGTFENELFRDVRIEDLQKHKEKFYSLYGEVSRFAMFGELKVNEFYYKWVSKSIKGELDDNCIGYYEKEVLEGFITYKIDNQKLKIGLVGVFPEYQGKKISQYLLQYINDIAIKNNCNEIYVSTQGKNIKAINAYIKSGFSIEEIKHWYYLKGGLN